MDSRVSGPDRPRVAGWLLAAGALTVAVAAIGVGAGLVMRRPAVAVGPAPCVRIQTERNLERLAGTLAGAGLEAYRGRTGRADSLLAEYTTGMHWLEGDLAGRSARDARALGALGVRLRGSLRSGDTTAAAAVADAWLQHRDRFRTVAVRADAGSRN